MTWDASRVSAAIPSGVGFLGAGLIYKVHIYVYHEGVMCVSRLAHPSSITLQDITPYPPLVRPFHPSSLSPSRQDLQHKVDKDDPKAIPDVSPYSTHAICICMS